MNELDALTSFRAEVPLTDPSAGPERALRAAISVAASDDAEHGRRSRPAERRPPASRRRGLIAAAVAVTAAVAAVPVAIHLDRHQVTGPVVLPWSGRPAAPLPDQGLSVGRARTGTQLVDYASRAAALSPPRPPGPHDWIYLEIESADSTAGSGGFLFGPPNERQVGLQWIQAGWRQWAGAGPFPADLPPQQVVHARLTISLGGPGFGLGGWKSVSYPYLSSLPTDPAKLRAVILAQNDPKMPWYSPDANVAVFNAVSTLLIGQCEGVWIPLRLAAAMYRLLQEVPGVHFDSAVDLAGRPGLGFYLVTGGWLKQELVISPLTYTFMGDEEVAVRAHKSVATDGTREIRAGQVLGWEALLASAIVHHAGQIP